MPKDQIVGEVNNRGWDVAKYLLTHEREMISGGAGWPDGRRGRALGGCAQRDDARVRTV